MSATGMNVRRVLGKRGKTVTEWARRCAPKSTSHASQGAIDRFGIVYRAARVNWSPPTPVWANQASTVKQGGNRSDMIRSGKRNRSPTDAGFDRYLDKQLHEAFGPVPEEPLSQELAELIAQFESHDDPRKKANGSDKE